MYIYHLVHRYNNHGFPGGSDDKQSACKARDLSSIPGSGRLPWRREWLSTPVILPGKSHGQRSLAGYSSYGHKKSDMTTNTRSITVTAIKFFIPASSTLMSQSAKYHFWLIIKCICKFCTKDFQIHFLI